MISRFLALFVVLLFPTLASALEFHAVPACGTYGTLADYTAFYRSQAACQNSAGTQRSCSDAYFHTSGSLYCKINQTITYSDGKTDVRSFTTGATCQPGFTVDPLRQICVQQVQQCPEYMYEDNGICKPYPDCPAGSSFDASTKQCKPNDPPPPPPECEVPAGTDHPGTSSTIWALDARSTTVCYNKCVSDVGMAASQDGKHYVWGPFTSTGEYCAGGGTGGPSGGPPGPPPPDDPPPPPCAKGTCPGTINGTSVCRPCDTTESGSSSSGSSSGSNSGGSSGGGDSGGSTGGGDSGGDTGSSGGTWNQKKYTTCSSGKCSTTTETTTTGSDGSSSTKTETKEEPKEDFCTANPKSPHCVEGTFGGACSGGFQCTGDAVQCAQAKAAHEMKCAMTDLPSEVGAAASSVMNFDMATLHESGPSLTGPSQVSGSCSVSDFSVSMPFGQSMTVRLSQVCTFIDTIRAVIGVMGALAFAVIVFKQ